MVGAGEEHGGLALHRLDEALSACGGLLARSAMESPFSISIMPNGECTREDNRAAAHEKGGRQN